MSRQSQSVMSVPECHVSLLKPLASGDTHDWFKWFDICCRANSWYLATKVLKLPTIMEGEVLAVWLVCGEEQQADYEMAKEKICNSVMPNEFLSLDYSRVALSWLFIKKFRR